MDAVLYLLIASVAGAAVFNDAFNDNLTQRIGLSAVSFGALVEVYGVLQHTGGFDRAERVFLWGLVIYAVGTMAKVRKHTTS